MPAAPSTVVAPPKYSSRASSVAAWRWTHPSWRAASAISAAWWPHPGTPRPHASLGCFGGLAHDAGDDGLLVHLVPLLGAGHAPHDVRAAHQDYLDWSEKPLPQPGDVNLSEIMVWLRGHLPAEAILCNGAGNFSIWLHRFWRHRGYGTQLAPTSDARRAARATIRSAIRAPCCWKQGLR